jgi:hypothetical protein
MSLSIPISGLNPLSVVTSSDFIPIVQSSSMLTTYRTPLSVVSTWISTSVIAKSAFSSVSSSHANSSDHAVSSDLATLSVNTTNLIYPNTSTAFHATSADFATNAQSAVTASFALSVTTGSSIPTSSFSFYSQTALSASFASSSFFATSASFASRSFASISASFASRSFFSTTASFATQSLTSSYSLKAATASFVASAPGLAKSWASLIVPSNFIAGSPVTILNSYNVSSISISNGVINTWSDNNYYFFTTNFVTPMNTNQYVVLGSAGERGGVIEAYVFLSPPHYTGDQSDIFSSLNYRTTSSFVFQLKKLDADRSGGENTFVYFVVYDN